MLFLFVCQIIWLTAITLFNIVSVGYTEITVSDTVFERDIRYWYNKFIPSTAQNYIKENWNCNASVIRLNDC